MQTSFSNVKKSAPAEKPAATKEVAVVEDKTLAAAPAFNTSDIAGEISRNDVRLPRLNLVARTGDLAELFTPGSWVLNKEIKLSEGGEKPEVLLDIIVVRLRKQYQESLPFGDPETPRVFDTAEEVRANGGTVSYGKGAGIFGEIAHCELLIARPESLPEEYEGHFFFFSEDKAYTHCVYTVGGTAYGNFAKPIISARLNHLREAGLVGGRWTLGSKLMKANGNAWFTPVIRTAGNTSEAFRKDVTTL